MDELQPWEEFPGTFPISRFSGWGFWQPSVDLAERAGEFIVRANLPGMRREDIQLTVDENSLTLQGEVQEEKTAENERFYRRERRRGSFIRPPCRPRSGPRRSQPLLTTAFWRSTYPRWNRPSRGDGGWKSSSPRNMGATLCTGVDAHAWRKIKEKNKNRRFSGFFLFPVRVSPAPRGSLIKTGWCRRRSS